MISMIVSNRVIMVNNTITINDDIADEFSNCISKRHPQFRGNRKESANEAVTMWNEWVRALPDPQAMKAWADKWTTMIKA